MLDEEVIVWRKPAALTGAVLAEALRSRLKGRVVEAYLFGSHARGTAHQDSDVDLILVADTARAWPERGVDFFDLSDDFGPVDALVYTRQEWKALRAAPSLFIAEAATQWLRLI